MVFVLTEEQLREELEGIVKGETVSFRYYERFNIGAPPKTLSTLMRAKKVKANLEAQQDKYLSPRQKIQVMSLVTIAIIALVLYYIAKSMGIIP